MILCAEELIGCSIYQCAAVIGTACWSVLPAFRVFLAFCHTTKICFSSPFKSQPSASISGKNPITGTLCDAFTGPSQLKKSFSCILLSCPERKSRMQFYSILSLFLFISLFCYISFYSLILQTVSCGD